MPMVYAVFILLLVTFGAVVMSLDLAVRGPGDGA